MRHTASIFFWRQASLPTVAVSCYGLQILHRGRPAQQHAPMPSAGKGKCSAHNLQHSPLSPGFPASAGLARARFSFSNLSRAPRRSAFAVGVVAACPSGFRHHKRQKSESQTNAHTNLALHRVKFNRQKLARRPTQAPGQALFSVFL